MAQQRDFDQAKYWKDRHANLRGDHRATGNIKGDSAEMRRRKIYQGYFYAAVFHNLITKDWASQPGASSSSSVRFLDIGCGTGFLGSLITSLGYAYTGQDVAPVAIEDAAKMCPEGTYRVSNIARESAPNSDIILMSEVLFHIVDNNEWKAALANIGNAMSPTSFFVFTENFVDEVSYKIPHFVPRSKAMYDEAFNDLGMKMMDKRELNISQMRVFSENSAFVKPMHFVKLR